MDGIGPSLGIAFVALRFSRLSAYENKLEILFQFRGRLMAPRVVGTQSFLLGED